ncbi:MAG: hypothetical protein LPK45_03580 [Bacteroidota bacterium]|nr:hypothetical protein [Bacteroidota bacterium]MDX5430132.1 hypothetical protein [Bacteroidota bacterium]MDX5468893.1 hypothetical protein [Bacteroidota bacterium]
MLDKEWEAQLEHLRGELILMKASIRETALDIIKEGFSEHPIFIAHQEEVKIGEVILDKADMATAWSISASTLEEFEEKNLIPEEKKSFFLSNYKDPKAHICLFVVYGAKAHFVYVPYKTPTSQP